MEGAKGKVGASEFDDMGDGVQCSNHPYRNNLGGICAFCLQEKLGKLVSSASFPFPVVGSSSPSSSPSFRSDIGSSTKTINTTSTLFSAQKSKLDHERKVKMIPFLLAKKSKKKKPLPSSTVASAEIVLKRSKSTATATARHGIDRYFMDNDDHERDYSPRKRGGGFWSFLSKSSKKGDQKSPKEETLSTFPEEDDVSPANSQLTSVSVPAYDRKVSRSRSVGCGSRSFSGDFFERISTGLGDCTLRRVESLREGKPRSQLPSSAIPAAARNHHCMKDRVKCGGIFGGFSSSSSSSSSSYWISSCDEKPPSTAHLRHNKSWNWAFASPMRAFSRPPSTKYGKREITIRESYNKNSAPNLAAIPSLLAVGG